jgi:hypothetical protein
MNDFTLFFFYTEHPDLPVNNEPESGMQGGL